MFESVKPAALIKAILVMAIGGFLVKAALDRRLFELSVSARSPTQLRGEYGGDLSFLTRYHVKPHLPAESNHYIDLWSPGELPVLARANGLTNNHALFIDSHGRSGFRWHGRGYALYPNASLVEQKKPTPFFSARDVASVLGKETVFTIHNIVIAGCNEEARFRSSEWRRHFPNATNITYMTPGKLSFKPMFYQAMVTRSTEIKPFYGKPRRVDERIDCDIGPTPSPGAEELGVYVADLYLPGARRPYRTQRAGRELLEPAPERTEAQSSKTKAQNKLGG